MSAIKAQLKEAIVSYYSKAINDGTATIKDLNKAQQSIEKNGDGDFYMIVSPSIGGEDNSAPSITIMDKSKLESLSGSQAVANMAEYQTGESWNGLSYKYLGFNPYETTGSTTPAQDSTPEPAVQEEQLTPIVDTVYTTEDAPGSGFKF